MFDPQFVIELDDISPVLFRLAQYPKDRVIHLGVILDDQTITDFLDTPLGMFLLARMTGDPEIIDTLNTYIALPVPLRGNKMEFRYAVKPYINSDEIRPEMTLPEFFDELYRYIEYFENGEEYVEAEIMSVCVTHGDINQLLGTPIGLFWLSQVCTDQGVYRLVVRYLDELRELCIRRGYQYLEC